jgi:hypothetical protein
MSKKTKSMLASYARSFIVAAIALYTAGVTDWKALLAASITAVVGPMLRAMNHKDAAFGLVADTAEKEVAKLTQK